MRGVSKGNLFWFLELGGFETVLNGFLPCAMFACQVNFCGLMICCMHIHNLVTSCVGVTELEEDPASKTKLNVLLGFRNTVLRKKQERLTEPAHHHLGWCWDDLPPFVSLLVCPALDPARRH